MEEFTPEAKAQMPKRSHGVEWAGAIYLGSKENLYESFLRSSLYTLSLGALS